MAAAEVDAFSDRRKLFERGEAYLGTLLEETGDGFGEEVFDAPNPGGKWKHPPEQARHCPANPRSHTLPLRYTRSIMEHARTEDNQIREITKEEGHRMLDEQTRKYLGISAEEFIEQWDSGHYDDPDDRTKNGPEIMRLGMLSRFAR